MLISFDEVISAEKELAKLSASDLGKQIASIVTPGGSKCHCARQIRKNKDEVMP
jgi:hypothetical protein